jgi:hypothetical protein
MRKAVENATLVGLVSARKINQTPSADMLLAEFVNIVCVCSTDDNCFYQK